jgi:hypothetical protein
MENVTHRRYDCLDKPNKCYIESVFTYYPCDGAITHRIEVTADGGSSCLPVYWLHIAPAFFLGRCPIHRQVTSPAKGARMLPDFQLSINRHKLTGYFTVVRFCRLRVCSVRHASPIFDILYGRHVCRLHSKASQDLTSVLLK